jgi:hypothetical protein
LTAIKNTLARLLVLVSAMGLSVVKPRLGDVKKQIAAVGVASLLLFAIYGIIHETTPAAAEKTKTEMLVIIPVSVLDALIFWWIFFSLHHTMKVLALRQNDVKLFLYKRFQFILAVAVIATIAYVPLGGWCVYVCVYGGGGGGGGGRGCFTLDPESASVASEYNATQTCTFLGPRQSPSSTR